MNDYIQVNINFNPINDIETDILNALLCDNGFESFVATETGVSAFIKKELYRDDIVNSAISQYPFTSIIKWSHELIVGQDWNEEWEKNYFKPMVIAGKCVIHSSFHTDYPKMEYDITIDPKMAFGTGHHSTTNLIVSELLSMNLSGYNILDVGTGTGILSIVSVLHGANKALGIEIDEAAYINALENIKLNNVDDNIEILNGDASLIKNLKPLSFNIVLANINRNVIINDIDKYSSALKEKGKMLLSGFYINEVPLIEEVANRFSLTIEQVKEDNNWAMIMLSKNL